MASPPLTPRATSARPHGPILELDGLRALAIGLVMLYHVWRYAGPWPLRAVTYLAYAGWAGVDVFFAISGFLITGILLDAKGSERYWYTFYVRRSLRIFPVYYAVLVFVGVAGFVARSRGLHIDSLEPAAHLGWNFLYLSNIAMAFWGHEYVPFSISWSLAVEEQYYLLYPLLVARVDRAGLRRALVAMVVLAPLLRGVCMVAISSTATYTLPFCRMDALAVGGLATLLVRDGDEAAKAKVARAAPWLWAASLVWAIVVSRVLTTFAGQVVWRMAVYQLFAAATAATVVGLLGGAYPRVGAAFRHPALVYVGKVSYGLYLFHLFTRAAVDVGPLGRLLRGHEHSAALSVVRTAAVFGLSLAVAGVSWRFFEKPLLALKDRWAPTRSG
jgi:peptidoglycan/LPS O-acetylase OafA/YrhL